MSDTPPPTRSEPWPTRGWSGPAAVAVASGLAIARFVLPIMALPYAIRAAADTTASIPLLILIRPGRPELLLAGFRIGGGDADLLLTVLAYIPFGILSVWGFFWLGRLLGHRIESTESRWLARAIPPDAFAKVQRLLEKRGVALAIFGRVAGLPPTLMAAAAATSHISARRYLAADFVGAVINVGVVLAAGAALGETYERAGRWFTIGGFVLIIVMSTFVSNWFQREYDGGPELDTDAPQAPSAAEGPGPADT